MELDDDEAEHSMEMHTPYIQHVFNNNSGSNNAIKLVPILVGALSFGSEQKYGQLLSPFLEDMENVFVISSDFCHWGYEY